VHAKTTSKIQNKLGVLQKAAQLHQLRSGQTVNAEVWRQENGLIV
jgi:hypothetical protein